MKKLKVKAVGEALVQDYGALPQVRRYIGRKYDASLGDGEETKGGWLLLDEVVEVPNTHEYRHEVKLGNLQAADAQTASVCGVTFTEKQDKDK